MYVVRRFDVCDLVWKYMNSFNNFSDAREARERWERTLGGNYKIEYEEG